MEHTLPNASTASTNEPPKASFETLPIEIRNEIYKLVLVKKDEIILKYYRGGYSGHESILIPAHFDPTNGHRHQVYDSHLRDWVPATNFTALLGVNRQIKTEAEPILYTYNTFCLVVKAADGVRFLQSLEDKKLHLRSIHIRHTSGIKANLPELVNELLDVRSLRTLRLPRERFWANEQDKWVECFDFDVVLATKPLLAALHGSYRTQDLSISVLDVVQPSNAKLRRDLEWALRYALRDSGQ